MTKFIAFVFGFTIFSNFVNGQNFKDEAIEAKDTAYHCFIKLVDGTIIKYEHLKYKMPPLSYGYLEGDGEKLKYKAEDIVCFQDEKGYWFRVVDPSTFTQPIAGRLSFDNFFGVRIVKGKIELFMQYSNNGRSVSDDKYQSGRTYFLKKGDAFAGWDDRGINLRNMMKDNKKFYNSIDISEKIKVKESIEIIEEYNKSK
jgi:hypothetical protein